MVAIRLSVTGRFRYRISSGLPSPPFESEDVAETVDELERCGVGHDRAIHLIAHARIWGSVEVAEDEHVSRTPVQDTSR